MDIIVKTRCAYLLLDTLTWGNHNFRVGRESSFKLLDTETWSRQKKQSYIFAYGFRFSPAFACSPSAALWSRFDWNSSNLWKLFLCVYLPPAPSQKPWIDSICGHLFIVMSFFSMGFSDHFCVLRLRDKAGYLLIRPVRLTFCSWFKPILCLL